MCALWNFGLAGWCLYPLARGCRAPRRMTPERAATAPAIPVWRYRLVAGAAELGGSVADRGACNNAVREAAFYLCAPFPRAREGGASATGFDPAAPARSYGDCSARADRNRWPRGSWACERSGISGWVIGLLIGWRAGAETARGRSWSPWSPMLADGEARRRFLFGTWRSAVAELFGNSRLRNSWRSLRMCSHSVGFWNRPSATAP